MNNPTKKFQGRCKIKKTNNYLESTFISVVWKCEDVFFFPSMGVKAPFVVSLNFGLEDFLVICLDV